MTAQTQKTLVNLGIFAVIVFAAYKMWGPVKRALAKSSGGGSAGAGTGVGAGGAGNVYNNYPSSSGRGAGSGAGSSFGSGSGRDNGTNAASYSTPSGPEAAGNGLQIDSTGESLADKWNDWTNFQNTAPPELDNSVDAGLSQEDQGIGTGSAFGDLFTSLFGSSNPDVVEADSLAADGAYADDASSYDATSGDYSSYDGQYSDTGGYGDYGYEGGDETGGGGGFAPDTGDTTEVADEGEDD